MHRLIAPTTRLHAAWLVAHREWGPGLHEDGFGLRASDDVETPQGFADWVHRLHQASDASAALDAGRVPSLHWWIVEDSETRGSGTGESRLVLGAIALRPQLNDFLLRAGGQVGYGVTPSARGRGIATWAVGEVLVTAGKLGLDRVLITCAEANLASAAVIEHRGGVLEDIRDGELGLARRYWITLTD